MRTWHSRPSSPCATRSSRPTRASSACPSEATRVQAPEVLDIARDAIIVALEISAPVMLLGLLVGLVISLVQALTQIQEQTLSFVSLLLFMPFMLTTLSNFTERLVDRIATIS